METTDNQFEVTEKAWEVISSKNNTKDFHTIDELQEIAKNLIGSLPKVDRSAFRNEMANMIVPIKDNPTTFDINEGLSKVQGYKTRLIEMMSTANQEFKIRKRCLEMLFSANNVVSKGSSSDKREGEANMRWPIEVINLEFAEIFSKEIEQIYNNLKTTGDIISRQGSMIQTQVDLGEYVKRGGTRTYQTQAEEVDYHTNTKKLDLEWDNV